ncbi:MAG TPA: hypothetical protein VLE43_17860, partial [Candidatus Saccharimonadia bacterium]|nr:hypothetical protein [Candidatus Saccharimonadia bacterium]
MFAVDGIHAQKPAVPELPAYRIMLLSSSLPYQIATPEDPKRQNWFVDPTSDDKAARNFGDNQRFEAKSFEK